MRGILPALSASAVILLLGPVAGAAEPVAAKLNPDAGGFDKQVRPFLAKYCQEGHGAKQQKGGVRLDTLTAVRQDSWRFLFSDPPSLTPVAQNSLALTRHPGHVAA